MTVRVDPGLEAAFGSATRVLTLSALAGTRQPLTGYRVAELIGGQRTKVYAELKRLAEAGIVRKFTPSSRPATWSLVDQDIRDLLRKRVRIASMEDWLTTRDSQTRRVRLLQRSLSKGSLANNRFI
jgi:DNA-binding transcriptional ArsR family regulator